MSLTNKQKSIIAMLASALSFSFMGVFVKLTGDISVIQKTFFRSIVIMLVAFITMRVSHVKIREIKHFKLLTLRSVLGTLGILFNYYALDHLILSDASVIFRLSTIFLILFSWIFLKEKISFKQVIVIIVAFIGVMLIIKPQFSVQIIPYAVAVLGAAAAAAAYTTLRVLGQKEHPFAVVFFFASFTLIVLTPFVLISFEPMTGQQVIYALLAGVGAAMGQFGVTVAYKYSPAKEVSIYNYSGVVFSAVLSIFLFDAIPDGISIAGYVIVFGTSYYMYRQNETKA